MCARVILNAEVHHALWNDLLATVKTGEAASQRVFGMPFYDHLAQDKARGALFDLAMTSGGWVRSRIRPAVEAYDFGQFRTIVDVGGGNGTLLVELLKACPRLTGTVFDLPRLAEAAQQTIATAGLSARGRFTGGNAFEAVPTGADAYILSNFLNSWGDEQALLVLRHCRKAMAATGKLILIEWVMAGAGEPKEGFRFWDTVTMDLVMLAAFGSESGRIRTRSEYQTLLETAGFTLAAVLPTPGSVCVIEAQPV